MKVDMIRFLLVVLMIGGQMSLACTDDIICIDITAKNVTANSVSLHWTLRHIHHCKQYDLMKVVCYGEHNYTTPNGHLMMDRIRRSHYYPAISGYGMLANLKPSMTFSCKIRLSAEGKRTKNIRELDFHSQVGAPEPPQKPNVVESNLNGHLFTIELHNTSTRNGPISGYEIQFHLVDGIASDNQNSPLISDEKYKPFGKLSTLEQAQKSEKAKSFYMRKGTPFDGPLPHYLIIDGTLFHGALKRGSSYIIVTTAYTHNEKNELLHSYSDPSNVLTLKFPSNSSRTLLPLEKLKGSTQSLRRRIASFRQRYGEKAFVIGASAIPLGILLIILGLSLAYKKVISEWRGKAREKRYNRLRTTIPPFTPLHSSFPSSRPSSRPNASTAPLLSPRHPLQQSTYPNMYPRIAHTPQQPVSRSTSPRPIPNMSPRSPRNYMPNYQVSQNVYQYSNLQGYNVTLSLDKRRLHQEYDEDNSSPLVAVSSITCLPLLVSQKAKKESEPAESLKSTNKQSTIDPILEITKKPIKVDQLEQVVKKLAQKPVVEEPPVIKSVAPAIFEQEVELVKEPIGVKQDMEPVFKEPIEIKPITSMLPNIVGLIEKPVAVKPVPPAVVEPESVAVEPIPVEPESVAVEPIPVEPESVAVEPVPPTMIPVAVKPVPPAVVDLEPVAVEPIPLGVADPEPVAVPPTREPVAVKPIPSLVVDPEPVAVEPVTSIQSAFFEPVVKEPLVIESGVPFEPEAKEYIIEETVSSIEPEVVEPVKEVSSMGSPVSTSKMDDVMATVQSSEHLQEEPESSLPAEYIAIEPSSLMPTEELTDSTGSVSFIGGSQSVTQLTTPALFANLSLSGSNSSGPQFDHASDMELQFSDILYPLPKRSSPFLLPSLSSMYFLAPLPRAQSSLVYVTAQSSPEPLPSQNEDDLSDKSLSPNSSFHSFVSSTQTTPIPKPRTKKMIPKHQDAPVITPVPKPRTKVPSQTPRPIPKPRTKVPSQTPRPIPKPRTKVPSQTPRPIPKPRTKVPSQTPRPIPKPRTMSKDSPSPNPLPKSRATSTSKKVEDSSAKFPAPITSAYNSASTGLSVAQPNTGSKKHSPVISSPQSNGSSLESDKNHPKTYVYQSGSIYKGKKLRRNSIDIIRHKSHVPNRVKTFGSAPGLTPSASASGSKITAVVNMSALKRVITGESSSQETTPTDESSANIYDCPLSNQMTADIKPDTSSSRSYGSVHSTRSQLVITMEPDDTGYLAPPFVQHYPFMAEAHSDGCLPHNAYRRSFPVSSSDSIIN